MMTYKYVPKINLRRAESWNHPLPVLNWLILILQLLGGHVNNLIMLIVRF